MSEAKEKGVSHIAYFRTDGGSTKLYTQEYADDLQNKLQQKENIIKEARELLNQEWYSVLRKETITKAREILDKEKV